MLRHCALALVFCLATSLVACDTGEPSDGTPPGGPPLSTSAVVGSWRPVSVVSSQAVVVNQTQTAFDLTKPVSGAITVRGAGEDQVFRYAQVARPEGDGAYLVMRTPYSPAFPRSWETVRLLVSTERGYTTASLAPEDPNFPSHSFQGTGSYLSVDWSTGSFALSEVALSNGSGETLTAEGQIQLATSTVPAGQETVLDVYRGPTGGNEVWTFSANGALRAGILSGTWEETGPASIRTVVNVYQGEFQTRDYTYRIESGALVLSEVLEGCAADCSNVESTYGLTPGTVVRSSTIVEFDFSPASGS